MKIMILGGTAFMGPLVAKCLKEQGHNITLFHRTKSQNQAFAEMQGDCNSPDDLRKAIETFQPDTIIHMVAMYQSHVEVLEKALSGRKIRILIVSSADVYKGFEIFNKLSDSPVEAVPFTEESPLRDVRFPYRGVPGIDIGYYYDKILVEQAALRSPLLDTVIARLGMVYGRNDPNRRFKDIVRRINRGDNTIEIHEKAAALKTCKCYAENVAHGIALASQKGAAGEIYNIADKEVLSELEWYRTVAGLMNWGGKFLMTSADDNFELAKTANLDQHLMLDSTKIRKELGFAEIVPLEAGLRKTIEWESRM
ncbi:MAG: NAD-dependent epimerase/dehydratase family protein [Clostridiales bacterium]|nr:NAD-dependent epimerase/dehydratase family protein [Clostridiales bacterium]